MSELHVDPGVLEAMAHTLTSVAESLEAIDPQGYESAADGLPHSATAAACLSAREPVGQVLSNAAKRTGAMAFLVRGAQQDYVATDSELGRAFTDLADLP